MSTRHVAVVTYVQIFCKTRYLPCLSFCERSAHTRNCVFDARRSQRNDVHIAFYEDKFLISNAVEFFITLDKVYAIQRAPLIKKCGIGGVFVFGNVFFTVINASAKRDNVTHTVHNRHDNSVSESVVGTVGICDKAALLQVFEHIPFATHISDHTFTVKRKSESVTLGSLVVDTSACKIFSCFLTFLFVNQIVAIIPRDVTHKLFKDFGMLLLLGKFGVEPDFRQLHSHLVGKNFHRVVKADRFHFHNEFHDVTACTATEAMIPTVIDAHRRSFLVVERTATEITSPFLLQRDVL